MSLQVAPVRTSTNMVQYTKGVTQDRLDSFYGAKKRQRGDARVGVQDTSRMAAAEMRDRDKGMYIDVTG